jgi:branched-chain amino acid aminotransferase
MLWFDGALQAGSVVPFDLSDRGLLLGDGVFDTALALNGRVAFEAAHAERLAAAARSLGFAAPPDRIRLAMRALAGAMARAAIRTNLTRGSGPRGLAPPAEPTPLLWASAAPWNPDLAFAPLCLTMAAARRNETSPTARLKTLGYLDAILAAGEARRQGFDEALFLNTRGNVACAGTGNVFAVFGGTLVTPPLGDGALDGIIRAEILHRIGPELGLTCAERSLTLAELEGVDALFVTNSLRLAAPVPHLGTTPIRSLGNPVVARIVEALKARLAEECGVPPGTLA